MTLSDLNLHLDMVTQLADARDRLQSMRDSVLRAQSYDAMPHGTGASDKVGKLAVLIIEQEEEVARLEKIVAKSEVDVRAYIDGIHDNRTKLIFKLRFLCGFPWADVADVIGGRNTEEAVKSACYRYLQVADAP